MGLHVYLVAVICAISSDQSIPQLSSTMTEYQTEINQLSALITSQMEFEQRSHETRAKNAQLALPCKEPRYGVDLFVAWYFNVFWFSDTVRPEFELDGINSGSWCLPLIVRGRLYSSCV